MTQKSFDKTERACVVFSVIMKGALLMLSLLLMPLSIQAQEEDEDDDPTRYSTPMPIMTPDMVERGGVFDELDEEPEFNGAKVVEKQKIGNKTVKQKKTFPKGKNGLMSFLAYTIKYPPAAIAYKIQGRVVVRFTVGRKGNVYDIMVIKGVHTLLDEEAVRVVEMMPKWKPGKRDGKTVPVYYYLPVTFRL